MVKAILDLPEQHTAVLAFLLKEIPPAERLWAMTGSAGLRLQVELLGDIRHRLADHTWSESLDMEPVLVWVEWHDLKVPVLSLEYKALAYERMGPTKKAELIRCALRKEVQ